MSKISRGEGGEYNSPEIGLHASLKDFYIFADYACEHNLCVCVNTSVCLCWWGILCFCHLALYFFVIYEDRYM